MPKVAIVILNWNGLQYLKKFLPSVVASAYRNCEVIVADNDSSDESVSFVNTNYPQVRVIALPENYGFAKGYNEALKLVEADFYAILNSDVEVDADWLQPMVDLLEKDENIAACQPKILSYNNKKYFEYAGAAGGWLDKYGYPFAKGRIFDVIEEDRGQYDKVEPVFWASGAALFIRSRVFHEMNGFDEYFFAHQEEIDLCWRIQLAGYTVYSCPHSVVYHLGGGTLAKGNPQKTFLNFRNNHIMLYKNLPFSERWWKTPFRIALDTVSGWKGLLEGDSGYFFAILRAHFAFLKWVVSRKNKRFYPKKRSKIRFGYYPHNILWQHFIRKRKHFSEIIH